MSGAVHIGTSGWHYKHWVGPFYPPGLPASRMLAFYLQYFDTVEINNSFYRLPVNTALKRWRETTPDRFCFAAKGSRFLTHMKKLKDPEPGLTKFFSHIEILEEKLGPVLFQLPPHWPLNLERLGAFLEALPVYHRYSFEFRNETWNSPEVYRLLEKHAAAYCIFHLAGFQSPLQIATDFAYVRLHGPGGKYQGSYSPAELETWARRIEEWRTRLRAVYVYFDNDQDGYAVQNARTLRELCP